MAQKTSREIAIYVGVFVAGLVAIPAVILVLGFCGALSFNATAEPPSWEQTLGQNFLRASTSSQAKHLVDPIDPKNEADMMAGLHHFRAGCSGCHGDYGKPSTWGTTALYPRVPQFAERHPPLTATQMFVVVKNGVRYSAMGAIPDSPDETPADIAANNRAIWQMVTFIDHMRDLPPAVDQEWKHPTPKHH